MLESLKEKSLASRGESVLASSYRHRKSGLEQPSYGAHGVAFRNCLVLGRDGSRDAVFSRTPNCVGRVFMFLRGLRESLSLLLFLIPTVSVLAKPGFELIIAFE